MTPDQIAQMVEDLPAPEYWLPHDRRVWRATVIRVAVEIRSLHLNRTVKEAAE
jgi:hypothetical protein